MLPNINEPRETDVFSTTYQWAQQTPASRFCQEKGYLSITQSTMCFVFDLATEECLLLVAYIGELYPESWQSVSNQNKKQTANIYAQHQHKYAKQRADIGQ